MGVWLMDCWECRTGVRVKERLVPTKIVARPGGVKVNVCAREITCAYCKRVYRIYISTDTEKHG